MRHTWVVKVDGKDVAPITLVGAQIAYGRRTVNEQPAPTSCVVTLLTPDVSKDIAKKFPDFGPGSFAVESGFVQEWSPTYVGASSRLTIGAPMSVEANLPGGFVQEWEPTYSGGSSLRRFTGRISALDYVYGTVRITGVDALEALSRITVDKKRPAETDVARARAYAQLAGLELEVDGTASVQLLAVDKSSPSNALAQLYATAREAGAIVYADREGKVRYRTRDADVVDTITLPPEFTLLDSLSMSVELGEIINRVTVEYGVAPDQGNRPTVTSEDPASIKRFGVFSHSVSTQLATKEDAQELADRIILNDADAFYSMPEVKVTLVKEDPDTIDLIADLDLDNEVLVEPLPIGAPATGYTARVIGYEEEAAFPDWLITYRLAPSTYLDERLRG